MNKKKITMCISNKINSWINSVTDETLQKDLKSGVIVTGGSIVSLLLNEEVKDYDIYFRTKELARKVAAYYLKLFKDAHPNCCYEMSIEDKDYNNNDFEGIRILIQSKGVEGDSEDAENTSTSNDLDEIEGDEGAFYKAPISSPSNDKKKTPKEYKPKYITSNAITLSDKIQCVIRFCGEPEEIHKNYDFVHCTNYWKSWDGELVLRPEALESIITKELRYVGSKYPLCSVIRTRKFINRGWFINAGQYVKMCNQISGMNLKDINVLKDQLIGVDSAYFNRVIQTIEKELKENKDFNLDDCYLIELIDKIF